MSAHTRIFATERFAKDDMAPLYVRLSQLIRDAVSTGELRRGESIPAERDIAQMLHVSRVTVRKAFAGLVKEGVLVQKRGSGTIVAPVRTRIELPLSRLTSFSEDMQLRSLRTDADWLDRSVGLPTPEEALKLSLSPSDQVCRFHRLRRAEGTPLAVEHAVIPRRFLPDPETVQASLYETLARLGARPVRALQRLHAVALDEREARLLGEPRGSAALFVERISYLADGRTVELTRSHYRGDSYDFLAELSLVETSTS